MYLVSLAVLVVAFILLLFAASPLAATVFLVAAGVGFACATLMQDPILRSQIAHWAQQKSRSLLALFR